MAQLPPPSAAPVLSNGADSRYQRMVLLLGLYLGMVLLGVLALSAYAVLRDLSADALWEKIAQHRVFQSIVYETLLSPWLYLPMLVIFALEKIFPADPEQKIISVSLVTDFVYYMMDLAAQVLILMVWVGLTRQFYDAYLSFLTIEAIAHWPTWALVIAGLISLDFFGWLHHYVRHRVPWFWHFHAIHHAQKNLNQFTDMRYHVLEYVIAHTIVFIPMFMLNISAPVVIIIVLGKRWYRRFYHANVKTDMGWLRYVLVTPQSHRIHHSPLPQHHDKNFGVMLSIWDQMFGTQYRGWKEYPPTGIADDHFPHESSYLEVPWAIMKQTAYPFFCIGRSILSWTQR